MTDLGVGARLERKEDDRYMRGRGQFVADIRMAGLKDVAFVRSPVAHARILGIDVPEAHRDAVYTAADMVGAKPICAVSGLPGFKASEQPVLATGKVRQVPSTLYELANQGQLPGCRRLKKRLVIHREVFTDWLRSGQGS